MEIYGGIFPDMGLNMDYKPLDLGIPKLAAWLTVYGPEWNIPSINGLIGNFHIIGTYWMDDK